MEPTHPIRRYRETNGLSQEALGKMLGRSWITVHRWESGQMPHARDWEAIKRVTGVAASELASFLQPAGAAE